MSFLLTSKQIQDMRTTQENHMGSVCKILAKEDVLDTFGQNVGEFTEGDSVVCGLEIKQGTESSGPDKIVTSYDAILRLPVGTSITERDKVRIYYYYSEELDSPLEFEICSPPQTGPTCIRILLRKTSV